MKLDELENEKCKTADTNALAQELLKANVETTNTATQTERVGPLKNFDFQYFKFLFFNYFTAKTNVDGSRFYKVMPVLYTIQNL